MISGLWQKMGFWSIKLIKTWQSKDNWIWFHAVSVGELNAIWPLVLEINDQKPIYPIMISTTTKAGYKLAKELSKEKKFVVFYFPFDFPFIVSSLLNYAKVKLLVIAETEIWPNILSECKKRKIPAILTSARLSDKSFKNYLLLKFYFKKVIDNFTEVLAQSENDAKKFKELGVKEDKITILGNIKFATVKTIGSTNGKALNTDNQIKDNTINIIFASTHKGEEEIAVKVLRKIRFDFPDIRLIIAPRHTNRTNEIINIIQKNNFIPVLKTQNSNIKSQNEILVLDTIGELKEYYKISLITVLGGTFTKIGGHNILEPIRLNSYTIIGPFDFKIRELSNLFKSQNAIVQVNNIDELTNKIKEALLNKNIRDIRIKNGRKIIDENTKVLEQACKHILSYL